MLCKERLRDWGWLSVEGRRGQGSWWAARTHKDVVEKLEPGSLQWFLVGRQEPTGIN